MPHKMHCTLNNQFSALENWVDAHGREPETLTENMEIIKWAQDYSEWMCFCDQPYVVGRRS